MQTITDKQKFPVSVAFVSAAGNPAKVDGAPVWSSSDETILKVTAAEDGMSASVEAVGPVGTAQVVVKADADLGEGVKEISGVLDVEVLASEAVAASLSAGPATDK